MATKRTREPQGGEISTRARVGVVKAAAAGPVAGFGRRTVSMPSDVLSEVERRVGQREFSAWMTDAARIKLERERLDELLEGWRISPEANEEALARLRDALEEVL